ncbi:unnamed protein product, partial [Rotaria sp. Silwood1]
MQLSARIEIRP